MAGARRSRSRTRWVPVGLLGIIVVVALVLVLSSGATPTVGYDVSYPQCSGAYPSNPRFAIVGVNGGLANTANACLGDELAWARAAPGQLHPHQPGLSFYIDTGNPGDRVSDWPNRGTAPAYGACNGQLTNACSYLYGAQRAKHSYRLAAALDPQAARTAPWWLDVELMASWAGTYQLNIAALAGYLAGLHSAGARGAVGIYSTAAQWKDITGLAGSTTQAAFSARLPDWLAGTTATRTEARQNCGSGGFTGVAPTLAQYASGRRDADLRC